jgi:hypothetical protein
MQTWLRNNVLNGRRDGMCSSGAKACSYGAVSGAVKFADADQAPLAADRAEGDIHAGEPQDAFGRGLLLRRRGRRCAKRLPDRRKRAPRGARRAPPPGGGVVGARGPAGAAGAAAEVAERKGHLLLGVAVGAVAPGEGDAAVGDGADAVVGDGDAVGVAPEVVERLLRVARGGLGVDDPSCDPAASLHTLGTTRASPPCSSPS